MQNEKTVEDLYEQLGLTPPESIRHLTEDELREKLKIESHHQWKQRGNMLYCSCELGSHSTQIPTSMMLQGTDEQGLPILQKIAL
jgi:hypothetical protein